MAITDARPRDVTIVAHDVGRVGGMERQLGELIHGLLDAGRDVTVVSRTCRLPPHLRLRWVRVPGPARPFVLAYPWFLIAGSLAVRRHRRGILHTTGAIVLSRADVSTVHFCHHASDARGLRSGPYARIAALVAHVGERLLLGRAQTLVGVSSRVAASVHASFPGATVRTIPNGVDAAAFGPDPATRARVRSELGLADNELCVLFVGSEWEGKGLRFALEAVDRVERSRLVVVGRGPAARFAQTRAIFVGETDDPARYYAAADAFVLPSAHETFSLVTHEAAAAGLPLLATRVGGIEDLLVDGVNGWFVQRDAEGIAERLRALERDPELRARMGAAARASSLRHDWRGMVEAYLDLYDQEPRRVLAEAIA